MKLSIILPSLRINNLDKCIDSILVNSYTKPEIILVGTQEILNSQWENCIEVEDNKCIGTTYAIQKGLERAIGEYVVTLSDDCRVAPHWDDHMIKQLDICENKLVLGNFRVFDHTGEMPRIGYYGRQFSMFPIMRREQLKSFGDYYSQEFKAFYSDPDLGMRLHEAKGQIINCSTAFIYHVYNPDAIMENNKQRYWKKDEETFIKKWGHLGDFKGCEEIK